jgi:protochlorophyllide reductase
MSRYSHLALSLLLLLELHLIVGFTFLGNLKIPSLMEAKQNMDAEKRFGDRRICVITGTSSGLGKHTTKQLLRDGKFHVIGAVRDLDKMALIAEAEGFDMSHFTPMECNLNSFASVRKFSSNLKEYLSGRPIDRLVCNAGIYQPTLSKAQWSEDGIEQQLQTNHLSHFLLCSLLLPNVAAASKSRVIMVGSVTGNDNTVGGGGVYPIADLRDLKGLESGAKSPIAMVDGYNFNGAKAYKDSKMCIMMTANELHERYHRTTGIAFSSIYPGCIAESPLFREKKPWFRKYFPVFMKYITGGFVTEDEAGSRLFQVISDPRCTRSGVYWSWNGGAREGRGVDALKNDGQIVGAGGAGGGWESIYENDQSDKVKDPVKSELVWKYSTKVTGAEWQPAKAPVSPCPTLRVIKAVTTIVDKREELMRGLVPPVFDTPQQGRQTVAF